MRNLPPFSKGGRTAEALVIRLSAGVVVPSADLPPKSPAVPADQCSFFINPFSPNAPQMPMNSILIPTYTFQRPSFVI